MSHTVPTSCPRWCDYADGGIHPERHRHHIGEVLTSTDIVSVVIESRDREPFPVLAVTGRFDTPIASVPMEWSAADRLADLLTQARERYA